MKNSGLATSLLLTTALTTGSAVAAEFEVGQAGKKFSVEQLTVKVGDSVRFTNEDPFFHNVFSLSEVKSFDLGSYPKGDSKTVVFDQSGSIEVECAIHPQMYMVVDVEE